MNPSKETLSRVLDIQDSWTPEVALTTITSEMGIDVKNHKIAYKTSKMKVRENAILIDGPESFAAGLKAQRIIQGRAFEQKHLKIENLVCLFFFFSSSYLMDKS
jgi:hypothetical protein